MAKARFAFSVPSPSAGAAHALPASGDVHILAGQGMAVNAMGLSGVASGHVVATKNIHAGNSPLI